VLPVATDIFHSAYRELRPRAAMPEIHVRFFPFASINNTVRLREGKLYFRISDLLEGAPEPVLRAVAHILIAKIYRKQIDPQLAARYRKYIGSRAISEKAHLVRQMRGRKRLEDPAGNVYHLNDIFDGLNIRFFYGLLARPLMSWSKSSARNMLGHYDPAHNAIVISRVFDHLRVPRYVVEYIVYHEMLHLKHPVKLRGSRRCVHPKQFQDEERQFPQLEAAKQFLKWL
jgi:hypothetical protein